MEEFEIKDGVLKKYHEIEGKTNVIVPSDVTEIEYDAFSDCKSLKNIVIPENVTKIRRFSLDCGMFCAFQNCESLTDITLPKCVEVEDILFPNCNNLINVKTSKQTFNRLWHYDEYLIVSNFARQYSTNNIYTKEDIKRYKEFIIIFKEKILDNLSYMINSVADVCNGKEEREQYIKNKKIECLSPIVQNKPLLYFMCNNMDNAFTAEELDELIDISCKIGETESTSLLMNYKFEHFEFKNPLDEWDLGADDNSLDESFNENLDNGLGNSK